jgi:hypothetical protein
MDTFAETTNVHYRLSFADQEKKTNGSCRFPSVSFFRTYKYIEMAA